MEHVEIRVKKLRKDAIIPEYQTAGAAGFDFYAAISEEIVIYPGCWANVPFGLAFEIPEGYEMRIRSRSGLAFQHHIVAYHGLIDSDYRGELSALLYNGGSAKYVVSPGERVAQGVLSRCNHATFVVCDKLSDTERGTNGFGSTGK